MSLHLEIQVTLDGSGQIAPAFLRLDLYMAKDELLAAIPEGYLDQLIHVTHSSTN